MWKKTGVSPLRNPLHLDPERGTRAPSPDCSIQYQEHCGDLCCELLQAAQQLLAYDLDQRASHPVLRKMSPRAGGKEELAPSTNLQTCCTPQALP